MVLFTDNQPYIYLPSKQFDQNAPKAGFKWYETEPVDDKLIKI